MPTLSEYAFERASASAAGPFWENHITHGAGSWAWASLSNLPDSNGVLAWERPDNEDVLDLSVSANNPIALNSIDGILTSPISRSGAVRTGYVTWNRVPSSVRASNPGLHQDWELLARLTIPFHASMPWYCPDADGTINYYVFFYLDGVGNLRSRIDGWWWEHDGAGFCNGSLRDGLNAGVSAGIGTLAGVLNTGIALFAAERTFNMLYLLPGRGQRSGWRSDNADNNIALAVLPN